MHEIAGPVMHEIPNFSGTRAVRLKAHAASISMIGGKDPGARFFSHSFHPWMIDRSQGLAELKQSGGASFPVAHAVLVAPSGAHALDDIDLNLRGICAVDGSLYAGDVALTVCDEAVVQLQEVKADSILIYATGQSRVRIEKAEAARMLVMLEGGASVEIGDTACDLFNIRQQQKGSLWVGDSSALTGEVPRCLFGVLGDSSRVELPPNSWLAPRECVQEYWDSLEEARAGSLLRRISGAVISRFATLARRMSWRG